MSDLISRTDAIKRIEGTAYAEQIKNNLFFILRTLPSMQPEPTSFWKKPNPRQKCGYTFICQNCGKASYFIGKGNKKIGNYCTWCGCKMTKEGGA